MSKREDTIAWLVSQGHTPEEAEQDVTTMETWEGGEYMTKQKARIWETTSLWTRLVDALEVARGTDEQWGKGYAAGLTEAYALLTGETDEAIHERAQDALIARAEIRAQEEV